MEGMGLEFIPMVVRCLLIPLSIFDACLELLGLTTSSSTPNRDFNLPPAAHMLLPLPPTSPPSYLPTSLYRPLVILQWL